LAREKRPLKKFKKQRLTDYEKIKNFILRNSQNGYFTRVPTIAYKFEIPHARAWDIVGELLTDNIIESYHDNTGEMKVCATGQIFKILNKTKKKSSKK